MNRVAVASQIITQGLKRLGGTKEKIALVKARLDAVPKEEMSALKNQEDIVNMVRKYIPELEDEKWIRT